MDERSKSGVQCLREQSSDQIESLTEGGFLDPSIDPTFLFNIRHPFPGIERVARRLTGRFGIVTDYLPDKFVKVLKVRDDYLRLFFSTKGNFSSGHKIVQQCGYTLYRNNPKVRSLQWQDGRLITPGVEVITEGSTEFGMQWTLPVVQDYEPVTHNHPEGIKGAQATALAIFLARQGEGKIAIKRAVESEGLGPGNCQSDSLPQEINTLSRLLLPTSMRREREDWASCPSRKPVDTEKIDLSPR